MSAPPSGRELPKRELLDRLAADPGGFDRWTGLLPADEAGRVRAAAEILMALLFHYQATADPDRAARLRDGVRRLLVRDPRDPVGHVAGLRLACHAVSPDDRVDGLASRILILRGLSPRRPRRSEMFEAFVQCRRGIQSPLAHLMVPLCHAFGMQAFADTCGLPVRLGAAGDGIELAVGRRRVVFPADVAQLRWLLGNLFLFDAGFWRWVAGFGDDDVFLDVGAGYGVMTAAAAGLFGARSFALEPFAGHGRVIAEIARRNRLEDQLTLLPVAAGDREQTAPLFHGGGRTDFGNVHFGTDSPAFAGRPGRRSEPVAGLPVDLLVERGRIPVPTRIQIDVDSGEVAIVRGMRRTLADPRLRQVRMEIHWWEDALKPAVEMIEAAGFTQAYDDDRKNLMFSR